MAKDFNITPWDVKNFFIGSHNDPLLNEKFILDSGIINIFKILSSYKPTINNLTIHYKLNNNCKDLILTLLKSKFNNVDNAADILLKGLECYKNKKYASKIKEKWRIKHNLIVGRITLEYARVISIILTKTKKESIDLFNRLLMQARCLMSKNEVITIPVLNNDLAYLSGVICGDGHIDKKLRELIIVDGHRENRLCIYSNEFLNGINSLIKRNFSWNGVVVKNKTCFVLRCDSAFVCRVMHCLYNIPKGNKSRKIKVPEIVKGTSKEGLFWRGMFDTDGGVRIKNKQIKLSTISQKINREFINFCKKERIITFNSQSGKNAYMICIAEESIPNFVERIGISHPRKQNNLIEYLKKGASYKKVVLHKKQNKKLEKIINYLSPYKNNVYIRLTNRREKISKESIERRLKLIKQTLKLKITELNRSRKHNHFYICSQELVNEINKFYMFGPLWNKYTEEDIQTLRNMWKI